MKGYIKWMDGNSKLVKVLIAIFLGILWHIYKLFKSIDSNDTVGIVVWIVLLFTGLFFILWVIDIFMLIFKDKVLWF
ncbi:MAG: hypothetical protein PHD47_01395 [Acholeplasmataceae bacterium]|nr:hypothetical protein [Acholeplasmataceae bacterium]